MSESVAEAVACELLIYSDFDMLGLIIDIIFY